VDYFLGALTGFCGLSSATASLIRSNLAKIANVVARLNQDARRIEYANHSIT